MECTYGVICLQRHRDRFTCCSYIVYNTSPSLYRTASLAVFYMQDTSWPHATLPETGDWLRICEESLSVGKKDLPPGIMNIKCTLYKVIPQNMRLE
jgi:hypothetical protein